jgi:hypothetical protein
MTASPPDSIPTYDREDIQQILNLAIARQADRENSEFSRDQLIEIATELGIPRESLQAAEREWQERQHIDRRHQEFNLYRHQQFQHKSGKYLIISGFSAPLTFSVAAWVRLPGRCMSCSVRVR